ncbi:matrix-remodeling-associated 5 isoform X1, putative [Babesia caballi]|uniref:Matrix-remodeling-associated 5 isoform X1, putative n=1 Tax=Babesia caballi TaxID=5871 RepID=A0AAV4LSW9_BABCB|nr:matrix-remodeling-associated 5 isoform X1, putative [Babesia caballi]
MPWDKMAWIDISREAVGNSPDDFSEESVQEYSASLEDIDDECVDVDDGGNIGEGFPATDASIETLSWKSPMSQCAEGLDHVMSLLPEVGGDVAEEFSVPESWQNAVADPLDSTPMAGGTVTPPFPLSQAAATSRNGGASRVDWPGRRDNVSIGEDSLALGSFVASYADPLGDVWASAHDDADVATPGPASVSTETYPLFEAIASQYNSCSSAASVKSSMPSCGVQGVLLPGSSAEGENLRGDGGDIDVGGASSGGPALKSESAVGGGEMVGDGTVATKRSSQQEDAALGAVVPATAAAGEAQPTEGTAEPPVVKRGRGRPKGSGKHKPNKEAKKTAVDGGAAAADETCPPSKKPRGRFKRGGRRKDAGDGDAFGALGGATATGLFSRGDLLLAALQKLRYCRLNTPIPAKLLEDGAEEYFEEPVVTGSLSDYEFDLDCCDSEASGIEELREQAGSGNTVFLSKCHLSYDRAGAQCWCCCYVDFFGSVAQKQFAVEVFGFELAERLAHRCRDKAETVFHMLWIQHNRSLLECSIPRDATVAVLQRFAQLRHVVVRVDRMGMLSTQMGQIVKLVRFAFVPSVDTGARRFAARKMTRAVIPPVTQDDIRGALREIISPDNLQGTSLLSIREELGRVFSKPTSYFDERKDEVNDLILEMLNEMYGSQPQEGEVKAEEGVFDANVEASEAQLKVESGQKPSKRAARAASVEGSESRLSVGSETGDEVDRPNKRVKQSQSSIMTRNEFLENAKALKVQIEDSTFEVPARVFSTNSCGWYLSEKIKLNVAGKEIICQVGLNCTVVGSKQWA